MGCFRTCDIFTRHSGVLTGGSVAATFYRVLHVMECPQDMGRQGRGKCVKMMHKTEKEIFTPTEKLIYGNYSSLNGFPYPYRHQCRFCRRRCA